MAPPPAPLLTARATTADLSRRRGRNEDVVRLADELKDNSTLKVLKLNGVTLKGAMALATALKDNSTLQKLSLFNVSPVILYVLLSDLTSNSMLQELEIVNAEQELYPILCSEVATFFKGNSTLQKLSIHGLVQRFATGVDSLAFGEDTAMVELASALEKNTAMVELKLQLEGHTERSKKAWRTIQDRLRANRTARDEAEGAIVSREGTLLVVGDGRVGKTTLVNGLRSGAPSPTVDGDEGSTIGVDISELRLTDGKGNPLAHLSVRDFAGQPRHAPSYQPFIVPDALYILGVRADEVAGAKGCSDVANRILFRWLHYLRSRAGGAVVIVALTHADLLLPPHAPSSSLAPAELKAAAVSELRWLGEQVRAHGGKLRIQETIPCVCAGVAGGEASLAAVLDQIRGVVAGGLLPSIGRPVARSWVPALALLSALPSGRAPLEEARARLQLDAGSSTEEPAAKRARTGEGGSADEAPPTPRKHVTLETLQEEWAKLAPSFDFVPKDEGRRRQVLLDAIELASQQGRLFRAGDAVYLDPTFVNSLLAPLVDHRLYEMREGALSRVMSYARDARDRAGGGGDLELTREYERLRGHVSEFVSDKALVSPSLLEYVWREADPERVHTLHHAQMLCETGVLFPLSRPPDAATQYIMPMNLPTNTPAQLAQLWPPQVPGEVHVRAACAWTGFVPPGMIERAIATLVGLEVGGDFKGEYQLYWARGALLLLTPPAAAASSSSSAPPSTSVASLLLNLEHARDGSWELSIHARGFSSRRLGILVGRLRGLLEPILHDFTLPNWRQWQVTKTTAASAPVLKESAPARIAERCEHFARAKRFIESLPGVGTFIDWQDWGSCFCECGDAKKEGDDDSYERGECVACSGCQTHYAKRSTEWRTCAEKCRTYAVPWGWSRFAITHGSLTASHLNLWGVFHRKFHGTSVDSLGAILASGKLAQPGEKLVGLDGKMTELSIPAGHISSSAARQNKHIGKREKFDPRQVFFSPTIRYAANETYADPKEWTDPLGGGRFTVQVVLSLLVKPGSYSVGQSTAGRTNDPVVHDNDIECYVKDCAISGTLLTGVLVRVRPA